MAVTYNSWSVIGPDPTAPRRTLCKCSCGEERSVITRDLEAGKSKSCGHGSVKDMTGLVFGELTVLHIDPERTTSPVFWICSCSACGSTTSKRAQSLRAGDTKSCGCAKGKLVGSRLSADLTGEQFGDLFVQNRIGTRHGGAEWLCLCECGNTINLTTNKLRVGGKAACKTCQDQARHGLRMAMRK